MKITELKIGSGTGAVLIVNPIYSDDIDFEEEGRKFMDFIFESVPSGTVRELKKLLIKELDSQS